jgi:hypothetical protein
MAEPQVDDVARWLIDNSDKEGTPDYVKMSSAYRSLRQPAAEPASRTSQSWGSLWNDVKAAAGGDNDPRPGYERLASWWRGDKEPLPAPTPEAPNIPHIDDIMAAKRLTSDPRSLENRANRVLTGAIGGIPDLGIGIYNAGARAIGSPESQAAYLTPQMNENAGAPELPADAPWYERLGEAGASAFLGGGAGAAGTALQTARTAGTALPRTIANMAAPTVVPTVAGAAGGEAGGWVGEKLGDRETGALIGSLLGGSALSVTPAVRTLIHQYYGAKGRPDAPQIAAAAERQGVVPTAGMLGNDSILRREQQFSGMPGSAEVVQSARTNARGQIGDAYNQSADARGSTDLNPQPGTIGTQVSRAAGETAEALRADSNARQAALMDRVGADSPVAVSPLRQAAYDMITDPQRGLSVPSQRAIDYRVTDQLNPLISQSAAGGPLQTIMPGMGHNGGPPMTTETVPYGFFRGWRTDLGKSIDTPAGGRMPPTSMLYEPATAAMRDTAVRRGVTPDEFNAIQDFTRSIERTTPEQPGGPIGRYPTLQRYVNEDPQKAFNAVNQPQNPGAINNLDATGHPSLGSIFGDIMRLLGNDTINHPQQGARGPAAFANRLMQMDPDYRATLLGPEYANVSDQALLANRLNVPTSQAGLTRAVGGQGDAVANKVIGSEALGQLGGHVAGTLGAVLGRILGVVGPAGLRSTRAGILEGPTARNALSGGESPGGINNLAAALTAIQAEQQQQRAPLRITVP